MLAVLDRDLSDPLERARRRQGQEHQYRNRDGKRQPHQPRFPIIVSHAMISGYCAGFHRRKARLVDQVCCLICATYKEPPVTTAQSVAS